MLMPSANNKSVDQSTYESSRINTFVFHFLLSCQQRVTVTSCFVYKVIRDLESIHHLLLIISTG